MKVKFGWLLAALAVFALAAPVTALAADPDAWAIDRTAYKNDVVTEGDPDTFTIDSRTPVVTPYADPDEWDVNRNGGEVQRPDNRAYEPKDEYEVTDDLEGRWRVFLSWDMLFRWLFGDKDNPFD